MASSNCLFLWYCWTSTVHNFNTLGTSAHSLIQKLHSISTSDIITLGHLGISCLASSSSSSWIIDSGASTYMTSKFTIFFTFRTFFAPSLVFVNGSSKRTVTGTVNLTSLTLTDVNYILRVSFNLVFVSHLIKTFPCSITFLFRHVLFRTVRGKS